jgi:hypothetical protein
MPGAEGGFGQLQSLRVTRTEHAKSAGWKVSGWNDRVEEGRKIRHSFCQISSILSSDGGIHFHDFQTLSIFSRCLIMFQHGDRD